MNNTSDNYSVSVIIPAYNATEHICRTIDSVIAQALQPDEIIVVDDGSTDNTGEVVKSFGDKVRYIQQQNAGASAARNAGIEAATSEWIAFLDADDEWAPEKLLMQVELLKSNPDLVWVSGNCTRCLCDEGRKGPMVTPDKAERMLEGNEYHKEFFDAFMANAAGWTGTMLIKRSVIIDAGLFDRKFTVAEDLDLWFRIAYDYPQIGYIAAPLATYHLSTAQSLSKSVSNMDAQAKMLKRHLSLAEEKGRSEAFQSCARHTVSGWIRSMLFHNDPEQIKRFLDEFGDILSPCYKAFIRILMISPRATAWTCHLISKIVRKLKIRKTITNPPPKARS